MKCSKEKTVKKKKKKKAQKYIKKEEKSIIEVFLVVSNPLCVD